MEDENTMTKRWVKIYPSYIDKEMKHSEGRKVSNAYAVDKPNSGEIYQICSGLLKLSCKVEYVYNYCKN
jgi:signal recognition particle subunit SEC65